MAEVTNNGCRSRLWNILATSYCNLLLKYPGSILLATFFIFTLFPLIILYVNPLKLTQNPESGFDTRGTEYSGPRLTWESVYWDLQAGNRIKLPNRTASAPARAKRSWADDFLNTFIQVPCYEAALPGMDYLTQFVLEAKSYEELFNLDYQQMLCSLHTHLKDHFDKFANITPYRNIWSLPNYLSCISANLITNCSFLTEDDVKSSRSIVDFCRPYRSQIIKCRQNCSADCPLCPDLPSNCSNQMIFDLFYRILPKNLYAKPIHINAFLPVFTSAGYQSQGINNVVVKDFVDIQDALKNFSVQHKSFKLKGLSMGIKRDILYDGARRDSLLACLAAFCVFFMVFLYSLNIFYCLTVAFVLIASVLTALAIYSLFTQEFPLLNLVIFVLLLAIGSDDAFVLLNSFPTEITSKSIYQCLSHTASAMLLTSASTAVPFFTNILSSVIVFRYFGLFAGLTLVINYLLEISLLPAMLIFQNRYIHRCLIARKFSKLNYVMRDLLPFVVISGRYIWISSFAIIVSAMTYLTYANLQFPHYNPLQLFVNSNEHEWYDNNAEKTFEFVAEKLAVPITVRLLWGLAPRTSQSIFRPDNLSPIEIDLRFSLQNTTEVQKLALRLHDYRHVNFINHKYEYWPERYLEWSRSFICEPSKTCCNFADSDFQESSMDHCIRLSTASLFTNYNDTLIYDNSTYKLLGYTAMLPTNLKYSHRFQNLSHSFNLLRHTFSEMAVQGGWYTTEWSLMNIWFDLLNSIITDCRQSLLLSFSAVTILAFLHLRWKAPIALLTIGCIVIVAVGCVVTLGWTIGLLEAVILILVVGLSFDFTLHYGASVPDSGCSKHRVLLAARKSAIPVTLSALSSVVAGSSMLIAETHAFYQVGMFLVVSASTSWLFATFLFLPLLSLTLQSTKICKLCRQKTVNVIDSAAKVKSTFM